MAQFLIYCLLAVPFRSYLQPFIIMSAIPFGFVGAILGHLLLGFDLSILSMFGLVALTGVVVNDSLLLVNFARKVEIVAKDTSLSFPWMSLISYLGVLAGIILAYGALTEFAAALLGRYYWAYPLVLLFLACVPIFQIGALLYGALSERLEEWKH